MPATTPQKSPKSTVRRPPTELADAEDASYVRLHVSPLDPGLIDAVLQPQIRPLARNISFHSLDTFPESRYGFLELPPAEAERLRRRLHGATLRGCKMKVERARRKRGAVPEESATGQDDVAVAKGAADVAEKKTKKNKMDGDGEKRSKKRKRDPNVVEGVLLEEGRKVKRGWTITDEEVKKEKKKRKEKRAKTKKRPKSEYTDKEECLMQITVPPNAPVLKEAGQKKGKKGKSARQITAHEFEHTTKFPTFLKNSSESKTASEAPKQPPPGDEEAGESEDSSDSSSSSSSDDSADEIPAPPTKATKKAKAKAPPSSLLTVNQDTAAESAASSPALPGSARPKSSGSMRSLTIKIPPPLTPPVVASSSTRAAPAAAGGKVHPLEALYKKVVKKEDAKAGGNGGAAAEDGTEAPPASEPFSFFGNGGDDDADADAAVSSTPAAGGSVRRGSAAARLGSLPPMTPYTRQDFDWRNVRSAAPTPDTAHPSTKRVFWAPDDEDDVDEDEEEEEDKEEDEQSASAPVPTPPVKDDTNGEESGEEEEPAAKTGTPESEFKKLFHEKRRELGRSWVERRKSAQKERRTRDRKLRSSKA